ncbi:MAG: acetyl-CoA carboxylase, carboxyltransferase subunit beta [Alphaproteobacteria bacterium]|nr:acetyl-CoA carboxylase, carboxyltransferase subunit beta [Alphaproteobacteria bacterium]
MSNWWTNLTRPGLKKKAEEKKPDPKRETPDGLWIKCPTTGELIYQQDLEASNWVTPAGFHMRIGPAQRFKQVFDDGAGTPIALPDVPRDPLRFKDDKRYVDRLKAARAKVERDDCMAASEGRIGGARAVVLVQDFEFMGGSLGMAAGEAFITAAQHAVKAKCALICVAAAGGARMQEGILSLMQMPRTTLAIQELKRAGLPYIVVLTDPTTGGVTASYAMLGDIHIAEPGALIGFAGPRVIEQTIRQKLPDGFQRAEYLLEKGMVDMVVDRRQLKQTLAALLSILLANREDSARDGDGATDAKPAATVQPLVRPARTAAPARPPRAKAAE